MTEMNPLNLDTPGLREFTDTLDAIVRSGRPEPVTVTAVAESLERLVREDAWLPQRYRQPNPEHYVMYPLAVASDGSWSVAAAVWGPGQETPIHDHCTWGVVGIMQGAETEERFVLGSDGLPAAVGDNVWGRGEVTVCCTRDADIHAVGCGSPVPCVGIHVYGSDIGRQPRHAYDRGTGARRSFVSPWALPA